MGKLWDILRGRVRRDEAHVTERPFLHDAINIKDYNVEEYLHWHAEGKHLEHVGTVKGAYAIYPDRDEKVDILNLPSSKGWIINCQKSKAEKVDFHHLMYLMYRRLSESSYILNLADVKSRRISTRIETKYRYYLKPSLSLLIPNIETKKVSQLYGNITVEYVMIDDRPSIFKFLATSYSDHNYDDALPFSELLEVVLEE